MTSPFTVEAVAVEERAAVQSTQLAIVLSQPMKVDLSVYKGDSGQFRITVSDNFGSPVDLTGATWDGDIRVKAIDTTLITSFDITPTPGDISSIDVSLPASKSELLIGSCVYDIEMREGEVVTTLIYGTISVTQDVSRPT